MGLVTSRSSYEHWEWVLGIQFNWTEPLFSLRGDSEGETVRYGGGLLVDLWSGEGGGEEAGCTFRLSNFFGGSAVVPEVSMSEV